MGTITKPTLDRALASLVRMVERAEHAVVTRLHRKPARTAREFPVETVCNSRNETRETAEKSA